MKYIKQFSIILLISFIGEVLNYVIPLPIPASIYGIGIMFSCLKFHIIPYESVRETGHYLIEIMPIMFIPAAVGLINVWNIIRPSCIVYLTITFVSTAVVMIISGLITQFIITRKKVEEHE